MYIIVKSNTHPLIGNYYFKKTRESVTLKRKMKKKQDYSSFFMFFMGMTPITFSLMSEICELT